MTNMASQCVDIFIHLLQLISKADYPCFQQFITHLKISETKIVCILKSQSQLAFL